MTRNHRSQFRRLDSCILIVLACIWANCQPGFAQGFSPDESVRRMKGAKGFSIELVAAEPLVRQPVAIEFDDRGRLWVIQYLQYPNPAGLRRVTVDRYSRTKYDRVPEPPPRGPRGADRITILEDTDGDGHMDRGRDFVNGLNLTTGLAFGHGGLFVLNVPYLLFYPDRNRDDVPDRDPEVLLTGFGMDDAHSVANSLTWGPDGWLYGCQGSTVTANVRGIEFQQGVWRYQPVTREFELFCEGGGNSWGLDFDRVGNLLYSTNYGGYVLLHGVQGGYYVKSFAKHGELHNPHAYGYFEHAPHRGFRGGHVTVGGIVYQGDTFPEVFRDRYIAGDLLGHAAYWHEVEPWGSTFRTVHGGELLQSEDPWFAPTDVVLGPDGALYVADWHDARTAHPDPDADWDRSNGRIIRIAADGTRRANATDFARLTEDRLLELHRHPSQWYVRKARMELADRSQRNATSGPEQLSIQHQLLTVAQSATEEIAALEALWSLAVVGGFDEPAARELLESPHPAVRSWTVRLLGDRKQVSGEMAAQLDEFAEHEPIVAVRAQLASTARRLPAQQALPIINANINRDLDNEDPYVPLLWWWAVEQHSITGRDEVLRRFVRPTLWNSRLGRDTLLPRLVRRYAAEHSLAGLSSLTTLLQAAPNDEARLQLWSAIRDGWREQPASPASHAFLTAAQSHEFSGIVRAAWQGHPTNLDLTELAVTLGHSMVYESATREAFQDATDAARRVALLALLARTRNPALLESAIALVQSDAPVAVRRAGLDVLARFEDPRVTATLLALHTSAASTELHSAIRSVLLSRTSSAREWLASVERGEIDPGKIPIDEVRQLALLGDAELDARVAKLWGHLRSATPGEKLAEVRRLNNDLRAGAGDAAAGKLLFTKHCASCHTLFGEGTKLGPDLTTANRKDRDFLLISLVDPDAVIRKEYVSLIVQTTDGRLLTGVPIAGEDSAILLADGKTEQPIRVANSEVDELHESPVSLMPAELYRQFNPQQLRDLFRFLQSDAGK